MDTKKLIVSYGIIVFTLKKSEDEDVNDDVFYLLSQRRDSIGYTEFLKDTLLEEDIPKYIESMSHEERQRCLLYINEPHLLWDDLWINHKTRVYRENMEKCISTFTRKVEKYKDLFLSLENVNNENPWGFPKGRKSHLETPVECALREFQEETSIPQQLVNIVDYKPIRERYTGYDGKEYLTIYYLGYIPFIPDIKPTIKNSIRPEFSISSEVSSIKWLNYHQTNNLVDDIKKIILKIANKRIMFTHRKHPKRRFTHS